MKEDFSDVFRWCVEALKILAAHYNVSYEEANIWLFVIIGPLVFLLLLAFNAVLFFMVLALRKAVRLIKARQTT